jgi:alkylated DNA repair dioxygenase AlkB
MAALFPMPQPGSRPRRRVVAPGAVHLADWLDADRQRELVAACRGWAVAPVPMRAARVPGGHLMSVRTVCLGWHWSPYRYTRFAVDAGGARVAELPAWLADLGRRAVADAYQDESAGAAYRPDAALINFYDDTARMGMHAQPGRHLRLPLRQHGQPQQALDGPGTGLRRSVRLRRPVPLRLPRGPQDPSGHRRSGRHRPHPGPPQHHSADHGAHRLRVRTSSPGRGRAAARSPRRGG